MRRRSRLPSVALAAVLAFATLGANTCTPEDVGTVVEIPVAPGGMGGIEVLRNLRGIDAGVRAIVTSGYSDDLVVANFRRHGFAGCLEKPYDIDLLDEVLANVLGRPTRAT